MELRRLVGSHLVALIGIGAAVLGAACDGGGGGGVAAACAESTLIAQCPKGSSPILGTAADSICRSAAGVDVTNAEGAVSARCLGESACRVVCQFASPCPCGVESITPEGVFCVDCGQAAACGDGMCTGGESPDTCPVDCGAECQPGETRCDGPAVQACNLRGRWDTIPCGAGDRCEVSPQGTVGCVRGDVIRDGDAGPGGDGGRPRVSDRIYFGDGTLPPAVSVAPSESPWPTVLHTVGVSGSCPSRRCCTPQFNAGWRSQGGTQWEICADGVPRMLGEDQNRIYLLTGTRYKYVQIDTASWGEEGRYPGIDALEAECLAGGADFQYMNPLAFPLDNRGWLFHCRRGDPNDHRQVTHTFGFYDFAAGAGELLPYDGPYQVGQPVMSHDGQVVATTGDPGDGNLVYLLWDRATGRVDAFPAGGRVGVMALAPTGKVLAAVTSGRGPPAETGDDLTGVELWNPQERKRIYTILRPADAYFEGSLAFSPRGDVLVAQVKRRLLQTIEVWDLERGVLRYELGADLDPPSLGDFLISPDGRRLASVWTRDASVGDHRLLVWDLATGDVVVDQPVDRADYLQLVSFSGDGRLLVTGYNGYYATE